MNFGQLLISEKFMQRNNKHNKKVKFYFTLNIWFLPPCSYLLKLKMYKKIQVQYPGLFSLL